ncbi:MAG TPA: HDIG domain-containing protein [Gemmatimonadales bacterium]|nr:HDIG domain-containing protein [Gemmatimonadales bacterium]
MSLRRPPSPDEPPQRTRTRVGFHLARWLLLLVLAVLTYLLFPVAGGPAAPSLEVGQVAPNDVVAPFEFVVLKTPAELQREGDALAATVRPIFDYRGSVLDSVTASASALFAALDSANDVPGLIAAGRAHGVTLVPDEASFLLTRGMRARYRRAVLDMVRTELARGVTSNASIDSIAAREIVVRRAGTERVVPRDSVISYARFLDRRRFRHPAPNSSVGDQVFVKLLNGLFRPTLVPNVGDTQALRDELRASVDSVKDVVRANERIVAAHEVVTPAVRDRLVALRSELVRRGGAEGRTVPSGLGQFLTNGLVLAIFWLLLTFYRRETYDDMRQMLLVTLLFGIVIVGAAVNFRFIAPKAELIPIPFAAMLLTVLFSGRVAIVAAAVLAVLLGSQSVYTPEPALYISLLGGVAAAMGMRGVRRRSELLVTVVIVTAAYAFAAITVGLRMSWSFSAVGASALRGAVTAVISAALVSIALPIFEALGRITTDLTLLELSDPARPLLRRLATEAPGTYAHSIAMANLCEAACNAIGANGLLARVGCYYHDIGKLKKPQFFVENQTHGLNPHDKLKPDVSAAVIRSHVKDGIAIADEYKLPDAVKVFIPEHHGTAEITYFLDRARAAAGNEDVPAEQFRYPGPRPHSVETAIAMLADGVEAALRVLDEPTPETVRGAIDHLVSQRVESGQLNDAPLTLADLDRVKDEFVRILAGTYHNRVDYPAASGGLSAEWEASARA